MIVAVTMVRDEQDIIEWTLAHMLTQVDHVIVADNGSTDHTRWILADAQAKLPGQITVMVDPEVGYWQSRKMTGLARLAHDMGAEWVVPFDADEAWFLPDARVLAGADVIALRPHVFVPQPRHDDNHIRNPLRRIEHRQPYPEPHPKVMFRSRPDVVIDMGNHGVTYPGPHRLVAGGGAVRHYQYRSPGQVARKVNQGTAAYDALPPAMRRFGSHWRELAALSWADLQDWWEWYTTQPLVKDPWPT